MRASVLSILCLLSGCVFIAKPAPIIPTQLIAATESSDNKQLVIVLPGMGDNLKRLDRSGFAVVVQRHLPNADVMLVELTLPYYMEGRATQRLHDEVIAPARQRGYRDIYLAGASMGGMGVLMYERDHPNQLSGLILMAPYMGEAELMQEIEAAGGVAQWDPGPVPAELNRDLVPREEWRVVKSWVNNPERARNVWLICGRKDQFYQAAGLVAALLPSDRYIVQDGGHKWTVWSAGADTVFKQIAAR
jgi:enterochelin esterase-like enzyme